MIVFIILICLFIINLVLLLLCAFKKWGNKLFFTFIVSFIVIGFGMMISTAFVKPNIKAIEYPASEYDFKIKVVEFEEHVDTILVVIPKKETK